MPWRAGPYRDRPNDVNVAVTDFAASIVTTQAPEPVQAPDHDVNVDSVPGPGVSVTDVPGS